MNFGNHIIKILLPKLADRMARSVLVLGDAQRETNCGNAIAEIGGNFFFFWQLWQCHCRKWEGKKIVVVEIWGGIKKKKCYVHNIFITFLQQIIDD